MTASVHAYVWQLQILGGSDPSQAARWVVQAALFRAAAASEYQAAGWDCPAWQTATASKHNCIVDWQGCEPEMSSHP